VELGRRLGGGAFQGKRSGTRRDESEIVQKKRERRYRKRKLKEKIGLNTKELLGRIEPVRVSLAGGSAKKGPRRGIEEGRGRVKA